MQTPFSHIMFLIDDTGTDDDDDINRRKRALFIRANMLKRKFVMCSWKIKLILFKSYCTQLYTSTLWTNYRLGTLHTFIIAYNQSLRCLMNIPYYCSAKQMFCFLNVPSGNEVIRKSIYNVMCFSKDSHNDIITSILTSDAWRLSRTRISWYNKLYSIYM